MGCQQITIIQIQHIYRLFFSPLTNIESRKISHIIALEFEYWIFFSDFFLIALLRTEINIV